MSVKILYHSLWKYRTQPIRFFRATLCRMVGHRLNDKPRDPWCGRCGLAYEEVYSAGKNFHKIMAEEYSPDRRQALSEKSKPAQHLARHQYFKTVEEAYGKCLEYNVGKKPMPALNRFGRRYEFFDHATLLVLKKEDGSSSFIAIEGMNSDYRMWHQPDAHEIFQIAIPRQAEYVILYSSRIDPMYEITPQQAIAECHYFGVPVRYLELTDEERAEVEG